MAENTAVAEKKEETAVQHINKVTDFSLGIFGTSDNFTMAYQMAKALSQSTLVPREYQKSEANCMIAIDLATRMKTSPFLVMQNLDVIQGKPGWNAKALIGMINTSRKYDSSLHFEEKTDKNGKPFSCMCYAFENGERIDGPVVDMDMAVAEGWVGKNGSKWKTMPQVMLAYRAASFFQEDIARKFQWAYIPLMRLLTEILQTEIILLKICSHRLQRKSQIMLIQ